MTRLRWITLLVVAGSLFGLTLVLGVLFVGQRILELARILEGLR